MKTRWKTALAAVVGGAVLVIGACQVESSAPITAAQFRAMLDDAAETGGSFEFVIEDLDEEARESFAGMLPPGTELTGGVFVVEGVIEEVEDEPIVESDEGAEALAARRTSIKWKRGVCHRIYFLDRNGHRGACPHHGETGPYDFVMSNRRSTTESCNHANSRACNYCDELIYTCSYCGGPRHYRWTYFHDTKYKF